MQLILKDANALTESRGLRFRTVVDGVEREAFVVRYRGRLLAYLNVCRHLALPLDFGDARFFDDEYDAIVCCQHGARYRPETGECIDGPCVGGRLTALELEVRDGGLWCVGPLRRRADDLAG
jgi:nitrite reductase/ring-hydroxylating ferredoxin subunit